MVDIVVLGDAMTDFTTKVNNSYQPEGPYLLMGAGMNKKEVVGETKVKIPLKTMNRHGLIAGATGSGKTKTLQILAEQLSLNGVPSLLMDIKGDLSGIGAESPGHPKIDERHEKIQIPFSKSASPIEFLSLSDEKGSRLRATVLEFGPILFSKILELNDTQSSIVAIIYKFCDDNNLPLLDLKDFKEVLKYIDGEGRGAIESEYGKISPATVSVILRKIVEVESQGADRFFGETSFDVDDLMLEKDGRGVVSILRLTDIQDRPKLFATFMLSLLAEIYANFDEQGDVEKPRLCLFIDEAHLIFKEASKSLMDQIESIIKLIRSKGVGIYFCTQNPEDIPEAVLSQLGLKIQHALRAFTAKDRKAIKLASQNYPESEFYEIEELITELGIGEALITALDEKGRPTELVHTMLRAPESRMDILSDTEIDNILKTSNLIEKYNKEIDRKSAYELLNEKIEGATASEDGEKETVVKKSKKEEVEEEGFFSKIIGSTVGRQVARTVAREVTRGFLGALGLSSTRRRRRR